MGHLLALGPRVFSSPSCPHSPPPPAGGLAGFTEPPVQTFRCLFAANCLCGKMLVPRGRALPARAGHRAGRGSRIPPPEAGGREAVPPGPASALLRSPGRGSSRGRRPARSRPGPALLPASPQRMRSPGPPHLRSRCSPPAEEGTQGPAPSSFPGVSQQRTQRRQKYTLDV